MTNRPGPPPVTTSAGGRATAPRIRLGPILAAGVTVVLWASAFVGIRYAAPFLSPGPLTLLRLAVGTVALGLMVAVRRDPLPRGRDWWPIVAVGVLWFGVYNVALNAGERVLDAGTASMVVNIAPILIAVGAGLVLREGFPRWLFAGLAVAFVGSVVVGLSTSSDHGSDPVVGVLLCVLAAIVFAVSILLQKGVLQRVSALQVTFLACVVGLLCTAGFAPQLVSELGRAPASIPWTVAYLGVFPTAIAFTTWAYALRFLPAGRLGVTTYAIPAMVVLLSWWLLGEVPPWKAFLGGALCLVGVALSRARPRRG